MENRFASCLAISIMGVAASILIAFLAHFVVKSEKAELAAVFVLIASVCSGLTCIALSALSSRRK